MNLTIEQQQLRRVVCAAIRQTDAVILGPRHFDGTMHRFIDLYYEAQARGERPERDWYNAEQGFIDQWGSFMSREEAWQVAAKQGQIIRFVGNQDSVEADDELYSENLY